MLEIEQIQESIVRMKEAAREGQPIRADVYLIHVNYLESCLDRLRAKEQLKQSEPSIQPTITPESHLGAGTLKINIDRGTPYIKYPFMIPPKNKFGFK